MERDQLAMTDPGGTVELLLAVSRAAPGTLGSQIEGQLRRAIRDGALKPGARVPSTRDLAAQLGVSRRVVVDAYEQLAAEGYLQMRQGARPRVSQAAAATRAEPAQPAPRALAPRFDFRPSVPDVSTFPRAAWLRALREALAAMPDAEFGYDEPPIGVEALRTALADYLGRVRGVVAEPRNVVVTSGFWQGLGLACHALGAHGARRIALEDPSNPELPLIVARAGLEPVPVTVDEDGLRIDELERSGADAVVVTPAHQDPAGAVLAADRRAALLAWLRAHDTIAIEDDYDAEYRYDRAAVGALQGLEPDRVIYGGSASKTLAPALRLGWLVVPPALAGAVVHARQLTDQGSPRIEQHAFAGFLARGELDRHLRRMRTTYRGRRDTLVAALAEHLPAAQIHGIAAGLHATITLPLDHDERAIVAEAARRRIRIGAMADYRTAPGPPALLLGYGQIAEPAIGAGVRELAAAVTAAAAD